MAAAVAAPAVEIGAETVAEARAFGRKPAISPGSLLHAVLLAVALVFYALHFVHLRADFPNHSPWMDWAKYTDEGWYGDAAIRHFDRGSWYVKGDFNPAAALPVWPLLEGLVFRYTGVGMAPARALTVAVFGLILLCSYVLLRRWAGGLAGAGAVCLLAVSPFCYAFMRMAILEPMLILLTLLALLGAGSVGLAADGGRLGRRWWLPVAALGLLLPAMVLTKTTALFLMPAVIWMLWARVGYRRRLFARAGGVAAGTGLGVWLLYYGLVVRPRYIEDYRYLFSANAYTGITAATAVGVVRDTVLDGIWMGRMLFPLAVVLVLLLLWRWRRLRAEPLLVSLMLWAGGYGAFLAYHANLQPRYYLVIAVPLTLLVPAVLDRLWRGELGFGAETRRVLVGLAGVVLAAVVVVDARQTLHYVRSPEYTFLEAARGIDAIVSKDRAHNPLVLSISGSDLSLMTGLPSICDDFGTMELPDRVRAYKPGWYVSWNQVDDDKMDAFTPRFHLERVASFPAMDDPERNLLILYRVEPGPGPSRPRVRRRKPPLPKSLETAMGQQPSAAQLEH